MEDTSTSWPISIKSASLKESVSLFEQEMILNKLLLILWLHSSKWVVFTFELSSHARECFGDELLNLVSLILGDTWSKREVLKVSSNSDPGGHDHGSLISGEWWAVKFGVIHITDMLGSLSMLMVVLDDFVEEIREGVVGVMTSCVDTYT